MSSKLLRRARSPRALALALMLAAPVLVAGCAPVSKASDFYFMGQTETPAVAFASDYA